MEIFKALFFCIQKVTEEGNKNSCISSDKDKETDLPAEETDLTADVTPA